MRKARRIHLDIETYRTRNAAALSRITREAAEKRPNGNTAKSLKEAWDTTEAIAERVHDAISKTAVNPLLAEVLFIAAKIEDSPVSMFEGMEQPEASMLFLFRDWVDEISGPETIWTAFNGKRFDFSVLLNRMTRHGITPPANYPIWEGRGWRGRVYDTMERLPTYDPFTSFSEACEAYGQPCKTVEWKGAPMSGTRVAEAFEAGEYAVIGRYCCQDAIDEEALYLAMTHGDTWGTFGLGDDLAERLMEIDQDPDASPGQKWSAARPFLRAARLI